MSLRTFLIVLWILFGISYLTDWDSSQFGRSNGASEVSVAENAAAQAREREAMALQNATETAWLKDWAAALATQGPFPLDIEGSARAPFFVYNLSALTSEPPDPNVTERRGAWPLFATENAETGWLTMQLDTNQSSQSPEASLAQALIELGPMPGAVPAAPRLSLGGSSQTLQVRALGVHFRRNGTLLLQGITRGSDIFLPLLTAQAPTVALFNGTRAILDEALAEWIAQNNRTLARDPDATAPVAVLNPHLDTGCNFTALLQLEPTSSGQDDAAFADRVAQHAAAFEAAGRLSNVDVAPGALRKDEASSGGLLAPLGAALPRGSLVLVSKECDCVISTVPLRSNALVPLNTSLKSLEVLPELVRVRAGILVALLCAVLSLAQSVSLVRQKEFTVASQGRLLAISPWSVLLLMLDDALRCVVSVGAASTHPALQRPFLTLAFLSFCGFSVVGMRILLAAVRNTVDTAQERSTLLRYYTHFYVLLFVAIGVLRLAFSSVSWLGSALLLPFVSFWVPQIVRNYHRGQRRASAGFTRSTVAVQSAARVLPLLYLVSYASNELYWTRHPQSTAAQLALWIALPSWLALQVALLESQRRWGGRWWVPARLQVQHYQYKRRLWPEDLDDALKPVQFRGGSSGAVSLTLGDTGVAGRRPIQSNICAICFRPVLPTVASGGPDEDEAPVDIEQLASARHYMVTPCNHLFHGRRCLRPWLNIKLECPTCRGALPPVE